ncbi:MAG: alpha/beta hydrolase [Pirellulaceae bacterium]
MSFGQPIENLKTGSSTTTNPDVTTIRLPVDKDGGIVFYEQDGERLALDVYRPDNDQPYPGVLMLHGGAWAWGSKLHWRRHAIRLAEKGYVVVAANYRLAPKHKFPAQLVDIRNALLWMKSNSETYHIDLERIATFGYSAGGNLALLAATNDVELDDCPSTNEIPVIRCVIAGGAPSHFGFIDEHSTTLAYWLGGTRRERPEQYAMASPMENLDETDDVAFFLYHAENDFVVPPSLTSDFCDAARKLGCVTQFVELPRAGHFFGFLNTDIVDEVDEFLKSNFVRDKKANLK